jgi:glutamyl/glutaminyl-tRNA synthetase
MQNIRLRFAPSPTGALHIGGVRTALYNYLLARKHGGTFILRIEDTDQTRYVPGAENYIIEALQWCGISPDEGPGFGGDYGPYRQSDRKDIYTQYAIDLVNSGNGYYAFDTPEELDTKRAASADGGHQTWRYDPSTRMSMRNSLSLPAEEVSKLLAGGEPYTIRLKVPEGEEVIIQDQVRGEVIFQTNELDDKVMLKADGMPTYHLANVVDDHLMQITHVIRGEEWLSSTAHHVLLYRAFGWEDTMPEFAHLPLILKPAPESFINKNNLQELAERFTREIMQKHADVPGLKEAATLQAVTQLFQDKAGMASRLKVKDKEPEDKKVMKTFLRDALYGKLSKRDGDRLGMPVFPLSWQGETAADSFLGFREAGFLPAAVINFLAFLGWNPGTEQEIFSLPELVEAFDLEKISRSGARFDYDKARWYNQQYMLQASEKDLAGLVRPIIEAHGPKPSEAYLESFIGLMKERAVLLTDFWSNGAYFFEPVAEYDTAGIKKRYQPERRPMFENFADQLRGLTEFNAANTKAAAETFMTENDLKFGDVLPVLRLALAGTMQGPDVFMMMELLGKDTVVSRLRGSLAYFDEIHS